METQWSVGGCLEIRQRGGGRSLSGSFPYGRTATVRDRGRVRKETFRQGAFSWQLREFARVTQELNAALAEVGDEALEATRDDELSLEQRRANEPARVSELRQELERRNIHILSGHSFDRPLGSLLAGNARVTDGDDAVHFAVDLPDEARQPSWMKDAVLAIEAGLSVGERVRSWARTSAAANDTPAALEIGSFNPADIAAVPAGGSQPFVYRTLVQKDMDGTLAYIGGSWLPAEAAVGGASTAGTGPPLQARLSKPTTAKAANLRPFPQGAYANSAALYAALISGALAQVSIRTLQNDQGDGDGDGNYWVIPTGGGFSDNGVFDVFPAWDLGVDPARIRVVFSATGVTVQLDEAVAGSPLTQVRIGIWA